MISLRRFTAALATPLALGVAVWAAGACADFDGPTDASGGLPNVVKAAPSLVTDIQPVLTDRCALGGCHSVRSQRGGLDLTAANMRAETINAPVNAVNDPTLKRIVPFNADASVLYGVLLADPSKRHGLSRMPLAQTPLTDNQIQNIRNWINNGAPSN